MWLDTVATLAATGLGIGVGWFARGKRTQLDAFARTQRAVLYAELLAEATIHLTQEPNRDAEYRTALTTLVDNDRTARVNIWASPAVRAAWESLVQDLAAPDSAATRASYSTTPTPVERQNVHLHLGALARMIRTEAATVARKAAGMR